MSDSVRPHRWQHTRLPRPWDFPGKNTGVGCHFLLQCRKLKSEREVAQSCPTFCDPMDCSPPGSSVHGIFQARLLEWGAIAFSDWVVLTRTNYVVKRHHWFITLSFTQFVYISTVFQFAKVLGEKFIMIVYTYIPEYIMI